MAHTFDGKLKTSDSFAQNKYFPSQVNSTTDGDREPRIAFSDFSDKIQIFKNEINIFIQPGCIQMVIIDGKDIIILL